MCTECKAFLHNDCAKVTQEEIDNEWSDKDFLCPKHRCLPMVKKNPRVSKSSAESAQTIRRTQDEVSIRVRVNAYTLNPQVTVRKLLTSLNCQSNIEPQDQNQQFYVNIV